MATAIREAAVTAAPSGDALWYKDAIIYQLHVRAFFDSNQDGMGDFAGLAQKLDYIQRLGVTAIWLLPFFPSPLRDEGYDIADYTDVNPVYGTLRDFKALLREAHRRDLRVITELVMNHTSDQHPWFQRARRAKPGTKWRDYYVWSDSPHRYGEARVIFQDFESANWSWDPVAGAYYWHRFYSHQPDLNFDNPEVRREMLRIIDFWLEMGVDGLRLDAVPYLFEREGTTCENLPETHAFLKEIRQHVDRRFPNRMLLAEANQWPEDAAVYFGDGDECHMNFHFPLMPRLFMAIEREDRFPVIDILDQTPTIPETCQWAIFLRNHDELTLEMVADEERDYMYRIFADDPQARVNLGIRRRLAPLLRNNRRKLELLEALLLSLPGTPIIYYGDEIGMGDNIYLGDRNGVRTPMQWNADRNAGFSRANPQKLYLPVNIDSEYHFSARNVEVQENSPHSLLWWTRRIIGLRRQYQAFSRGSIEFLYPDNPKVLAFLRRGQDETLFVVANLSRFSQPAELDLSEFRGQLPMELFGQVRFPPIGQLPYFLTLGPYAFYWFRLAWASSENVRTAGEPLPTIRVRSTIDGLFDGSAKVALDKALRAFLSRQRWFAGKARTLRGTDLLDVFAIPAQGGIPFRLLLVEVQYAEGEPDVYLLAVVFADSERGANILGDHPALGIAEVQLTDSDRRYTLCDACWEREFWTALVDSVSQHRVLRGKHGTITAVLTKAFRRLAARYSPDVMPSLHGGEQSNTSAIFADAFIVKLFRRLHRGINPDFEIARFLTERVPTDIVPDAAAAWEYRREGKAVMMLAVWHEFLANEGDAWVHTLDELGRFFERIQTAPANSRDGSNLPGAAGSPLELAAQEPPELVRAMIGPYLQSAELLGRRTAQLHSALAADAESPDFSPTSFTKLYRRSLYQSMRVQARSALALLKKQLPTLAETIQPVAKAVLAEEKKILDAFRRLLELTVSAQRIRCHGDYHLGQVLFTGKDFRIIDFEGEPERSLTERRIKTSPLKDVAGMIRSFHYAVRATLAGQTVGTLVAAEPSPFRAEWADIWYRWTAATFLKGYLAQIQPPSLLPTSPQELEVLLDAFVLQKALYELSYELNNRPDWVGIPLEGIQQWIK